MALLQCLLEHMTKTYFHSCFCQDEMIRFQKNVRKKALYISYDELFTLVLSFSSISQRVWTKQVQNLKTQSIYQIQAFHKHS